MADVGNLVAKLTLDTTEFSAGTADAGKKATVFGQVLQANLATKGIGVAIEGLKELGRVAVDTFKDAINSYAEFEQLAGGAQLVFGDSYDYIAQKASDAYKTVQMSQSEYLQQVNGLAVGLKNALGGNAQAAAELADRIVTAEADVVAAMGITQEAAQNAFNGIMRGNYTMVDNLGIGIAGTKEGIQSMIEKVNEWNTAQGEATQYTIENVADVQNALIDYIEMQGLAGYAANEATGTISGSIASLKAAWRNLVAGLADDNADIDKLIDNLVSAAENAFKVLLPVAEKALDGLFELGKKLLPRFVELGAKIAGAILEGLLKLLFKPIAWIMELLGMGDGTSMKFDNGSFGTRASGGRITAGSTFLVCEQGPELITPMQSGYVHTAEESAGMLGGGQPINININGDVYDDERSMRDKLTSAVVDIIGTELAYG